MLRTLVLVAIVVLYSTVCRSVPLPRNTVRGVLDQHLGNTTAADILADALLEALQGDRAFGDKHDSSNSVANYAADASSPQVVSVANEVAAERHAEDLKTAAERLAKMEAKQKLISIEIVKVDPTRNQYGKNIGKEDHVPPKGRVRKIRRRKLVHRGSLRTTTEAIIASTTETPSNYSEDLNAIVTMANDAPFTVTEVSSDDVVTSPAAATTTEMISTPTTELPSTTEEPPTTAATSEQSITSLATERPATATATEAATSTTTQTESPTTVKPKDDEPQKEVLSDTTVANEALTDLTTVTSDHALVAVTAIPSHSNKIESEQEVLAAATNESPTVTTETPSSSSSSSSSVELKTVTVRRPSGIEEVQVLSNSRQVPEVNLAHVHIYPKVPMFTGPSQVAINIGGLRYMRVPRRIKFKVPKGGSQNLVVPRGYSLLKGEPAASASHDEFTFVREETTLPATATTEPTTATTEPTSVDTESTTTNSSEPTTTNSEPTTTNSEPTSANPEPTLADTELFNTTPQATPMGTQVTTEVTTEPTVASIELTAPVTAATTATAESATEQVVTEQGTTVSTSLLTQEVLQHSDIIKPSGPPVTEVSVATSISDTETTTDPAPTSSAEGPNADDSELNGGNLLIHLAQNTSELAAAAASVEGPALDQLQPRTDTETPDHAHQLSAARHDEVAIHVRKPEEVTEDWVSTPTPSPYQPVEETQPSFELTTFATDSATEDDLFYGDRIIPPQRSSTNGNINLEIKSAEADRISAPDVMYVKEGPRDTNLDPQISKTDSEDVKDKSSIKMQETDTMRTVNSSQGYDALLPGPKLAVGDDEFVPLMPTTESPDHTNTVKSETVTRDGVSQDESPTSTERTPTDNPLAAETPAQNANSELQTELVRSIDVTTEMATEAESSTSSDNEPVHEDTIIPQRFPVFGLEKTDTAHENRTSKSLQSNNIEAAVKAAKAKTTEAPVGGDILESNVERDSQNEVPLILEDVVTDTPLEKYALIGQTQPANPLHVSPLKTDNIPTQPIDAVSNKETGRGLDIPNDNTPEDTQTEKFDQEMLENVNLHPDRTTSDISLEHDPPVSQSTEEPSTEHKLPPVRDPHSSASPIELTKLNTVTSTEAQLSEASPDRVSADADRQSENPTEITHTEEEVPSIKPDIMPLIDEDSPESIPSVGTIPGLSFGGNIASRKPSENRPELDSDSLQGRVTGFPTDSPSAIRKNTGSAGQVVQPAIYAKHPKMRMLDQVNVPVLPFGGNRFAELGFEMQHDGRMRMVINEIMAIIREEAMTSEGTPEVAEDDKTTSRSPGRQSMDFPKDQRPLIVEAPIGDYAPVGPHPPILSQSKDATPLNPFLNSSVITDVARSGGKILMPDAPTIIMQVPPPTTPVARFALRRIPGHINVPSVYEILDPEGRKNNNGPATVVDNVAGRAIVTLPLLPLRALPPIQQNYYRYNRIQPFSPLQAGQGGGFQQSGHHTLPQTPDLYPRQFQTAAYPPPAPGYERLFPQSYPTPQGNIFYINTAR